jgi:integrase/recombinase XerD
MVVHAVSVGAASGRLVAVLYEVADDRDLPDVARGEDGLAWRPRARHRLHEPQRPVDAAADADIVAVLGACRSARDRLIVLLLARAGLRRGEAAGLRRSDVHLLVDSRPLGCPVGRAHVHVVRREDNPNRAVAKSRRGRVVPLDFLTVRAFDTYALERARVDRAAGSDFVLVNLFREPVGAPMRPDAIGEQLAAASRRAGVDPAVRPHQLRHAFGTNVQAATGALDVTQDLLGHASISSTQVYLHFRGGPAPDRRGSGHHPQLRPARQPALARRGGAAGVRPHPLRHRRDRRPLRQLHRTIQRAGRRRGLPSAVPLRRLRPLPHRRLPPARPDHLPR